MRIPHGAQEILDANKAGKRPDELVIVSLVGNLAELNKTLIADGPDYDWRFVFGLEICIFSRPGKPTLNTTMAIGRNLPARLMVWDVENKEGADASVHVNLDALDKPYLWPQDWSVIWTPWLAWENKKFEEVVR